MAKRPNPGECQYKRTNEKGTRSTDGERLKKRIQSEPLKIKKVLFSLFLRMKPKAIK